jgi:hypothetical protein
MPKNTNKTGLKGNIIHLMIIGIFGIAFAFAESSVVIYLNRINTLEPNNVGFTAKPTLNLGFIAFETPEFPVISSSSLYRVEKIREAATIVMLFSFAWLSGIKFRHKVAAFLIVFSVWDIFYYVFLRLITGWPASLLSPDVFFLLPVPWVGPVITPIVICIFMLPGGIYLNLT